MKQKSYTEMPLSEEAIKARDIYLTDVFNGLVENNNTVSINYGVVEINGNKFKYRCKTTVAKIDEEEYNKIIQSQIKNYGTKH